MFLLLTILLPFVSAGGIQRPDSLITPASMTERCATSNGGCMR